MFPKIFSKTESDEQRSVAPGARVDEQSQKLGIEPFADGSVPQDQDNGSASVNRRKYLETLYPDNWSSRFECMGELIVERKADPSDIVKVYKTLNEGLEADIVYVNPTSQGMSIVFGIKDLDMFINSIPQMPRLASWALTHA